MLNNSLFSEVDRTILAGLAMTTENGHGPIPVVSLRDAEATLITRILRLPPHEKSHSGVTVYGNAQLDYSDPEKIGFNNPDNSYIGLSVETDPLTGDAIGEGYYY